MHILCDCALSMVQIYNFFAISSQPTLKKTQSLTFYDACVIYINNNVRVYSLMYPKLNILILKFMFVIVALKAQKRIAQGRA